MKNVERQARVQGFRDLKYTSGPNKFYLQTARKDIEKMWKDKCFACKDTEFQEREVSKQAFKYYSTKKCLQINETGTRPRFPRKE